MFDFSHLALAISMVHYESDLGQLSSHNYLALFIQPLLGKIWQILRLKVDIIRD